MILSTWKAATIANGGTSSSEVNLGRAYDMLIIVIPTITSATIKIQGSETTGGTFYDIYTTDPADGHESQVITVAGTGSLVWVAPIGGFQYIKVVSSVAQGAERLIRVCGTRP